MLTKTTWSGWPRQTETTGRDGAGHRRVSGPSRLGRPCDSGQISDQMIDAYTARFSGE